MPSGPPNTMQHTHEFHYGPLDGQVDVVDATADVPKYVSRGCGIYRHVSIASSDTVSVYAYLKSVLAGEVQATLDKLNPG